MQYGYPVHPPFAMPYGVAVAPVGVMMPGLPPMPPPAAYGQDGARSWYGRTRTEVEYDNAIMAAQAHAAAVEATQNFKPDAKPDDLFWVWETDGRTRNLYRFGIISAWSDGHWRIDPSSKTAYYIRGRKA
jgi:hypothetical protein